MYPNTPNSQQPLPADYLNQIAPIQGRNNGLFGGKRLLVFGLIAAVIIMLILSAASAIMSGSPKNTETLAARLMTTQKIAEDATTKLKSTGLRAVNSNLKLFLTDTIRDITPLLAKQEVDINELSKSAIAAESSEELLANLEDARLNAVYDRTYAREMAYKLETVLSLMKQIYSSTSDEELKKFLETSYSNLGPTQESFAKFNATNS